MQHTTQSFKTADGFNIHTEAWLPESDPKAIVLFSHGIAEHMGRYPHVAAYLVEHGYAFYGLDHRGHGQSDGQRAYFDRFEAVVDDLKTYFDCVRTAHPGKKIFLYGHSLGSLIALVITLRYQEHLAGLMVTGVPLMVETGQPQLLVAIGAFLDGIAPQLPLTKLESKGLSHDPKIAHAYDTDPLVCRGSVRVHMANHIVQQSRQVRARVGEFRLPLLILHGGDDPICPLPGGVFLNQGASSTDKTFKIYPGLYHEIHNELEKETVLADIVGWLEQHSL
ncbi:MAG TPA: alpha/beta hydrolase [Phototrophicaceae bacterium]|nr:alpha/beta hydrolase [Phototrophicaceae bacterium]